MEDIEELVLSLSETLLWESISAYIEDISQAKIIMEGMSKSEGYQSNKEVIDCSIIDSEGFSVEDIEVKEENILISFEIPFILSVNMKMKIEAVAVGTCHIPNASNFNYNQYDFSSMNKRELLKYKDIVRDIKINYENIELLGQY